MKIKEIQPQNCYKSKTIPAARSQNSNITFKALQLKRNGFTTSDSFQTLKIGALGAAAATSIKELFFNKILDISTVGQIKQKAICFGKSLAENIYQNNGKFNPKEIEKLVLTHLREEDRKNIQVVTDEEGFCNFATKHMKLDREYAKSVFQKCEGLAAQSSDGEMMFLLKLEDKEPEIAAHIATHEFEHLLYKTSSFIGKLIKIHIKEESKKEKTDNSIDQFGESCNKKFFNLQNALIGLIIGKNATTTPFEYIERKPTLEEIIKLSPELSSKKDLDKWLEKYIRQNLIQPNCDESNLAELQGFEIVLRDEARAYDAGGKVQKHYNELISTNKNKTTMAEMIAVIYEQMADKIQKYKMLIVYNSLKKSIGLKPIDYHEPTPEESPSTGKVSNTK